MSRLVSLTPPARTFWTLGAFGVCVLLQAVWSCVVGLVRRNRGGEDVAVALYASTAALLAAALAAQVFGVVLLCFSFMVAVSVARFGLTCAGWTIESILRVSMHACSQFCTCSLSLRARPDGCACSCLEACV